MENILTQDEINFIKNLSHEIKTQDTRCTAQPYGLVIRNKHRVYGFEQGNAEFTGIYDTADCENFYHEDEFEDFIEVLRDNLEEDQLKEFNDLIEEHCIESFYDLDIWCNEFIPSHYEMQGYREELTADSSNGCYEGNFFLTEKAAFSYIDRNRHNLNEPDTYGIHLYRNPEMQQLISILVKLGEKL